MKFSISIILTIALAFACTLSLTYAEDGNANANANANAYYEANAADESAAASSSTSGGLTAPTWNDVNYKIERCYEDSSGVDHLVWSFYDSSATDYCLSFDYSMSLTTPVTDIAFVAGGVSVACIAGVDIDGVVNYSSVGCSSTSSKKLSVYTYTTADCSDTPVEVASGSEDATIAATLALITFNTCSPCISDAGVATCDSLWSISAYCDDDCVLYGTYMPSKKWTTKTIVALCLEIVAISALTMCLVKTPNKNTPLLNGDTENAQSQGLTKMQFAGLGGGFTLLTVSLAAAGLVRATLIVLFVTIIAQLVVLFRRK